MPASDLRFAAVVAVTQEWGIGAASGTELPWHPRRLHLDMQFLRAVTINGYESTGATATLRDAPPAGEVRNAVIMGRRTWESIPKKFKPMPGRVNVVVTSAPVEVADGRAVFGAQSLDAALETARAAIGAGGQIFVLGGARMYAEAVSDARCDVVFVTRLLAHPPMPCSVFFPHEAYSKSQWSISNITAACYATLKDASPALRDGANVLLVEGRIVQPSDDIEYAIEAHFRASV